MISDFLPSLGNHLWQSTVFALCAAMFALGLRRIPARARFWIWFAATLKFLLPLSLLFSLGSFLVPAANQGVARLQPAAYYSVDAVSQPFTFAPPVVSDGIRTVVSTPMQFRAYCGATAIAVWIFGVVTALCIWLLHWRRIVTLVQNSAPMTDGPEYAALSKLQARIAPRISVRLAISEDSLEPGIFGIACPTLVWPRGISQHLSDGQMEAVIAHELVHVRRRDNLTAAFYMLISALFWFHPLIWWLQSRLLDERERACDEAVVLLGSEPEVYAMSLLRACEFSIESPLACVSGITGSDLKQRVRRIMAGSRALTLTLACRVLLASLAGAVILVPIAFGFFDAPRLHAALFEGAAAKPQPTFEVATVKPTKDTTRPERSLMISGDRFSTKNIPLRDVIMFAYNANSPSQISGYPDWVASAHYDIEAKADETTATALTRLSPDERTQRVRLMVQGLLAERFHLKVSREVKEVPVYALVIASGAPKLAETADPPPLNSNTRPRGGGFRSHGPGEVQAINVTLNMFAAGLLSKLPEANGRIVIDNTGLKGHYDFVFKWAPDPETSANAEPGGGPSLLPVSDNSAPGLLTALQEQLGLKLESQKGAVESLVVDHVEQPSPN